MPFGCSCKERVLLRHPPGGEGVNGTAVVFGAKKKSLPSEEDKLFSVLKPGNQPLARTLGACARTEAKLLASPFPRLPCGHCQNHKEKIPDPLLGIEDFCLKPGSDLLSHGETPHYHRRCSVSLLSSRWDQVVPELYSRQANWLALANSVRS